MVTYRSTRGDVNGASFEEVVLGGLAPDRGLYVPESIPVFSNGEVGEARRQNEYLFLRGGSSLAENAGREKASQQLFCGPALAAPTEPAAMGPAGQQASLPACQPASLPASLPAGERPTAAGEPP